MVAVLAGAAKGGERDVLARDVYLHRLAALVSAMAAALGGLDVLAFAGGVGEHSAEVRAATAQRCAFLGLELDDDGQRRRRRRRRQGERSDESGAVEVVPAREDLEMARQVEQLLGR